MTSIRTMKGPYLEFNMEEDFLLSQLSLVKDQLNNDVVKIMTENDQGKFLKQCEVFVDIVEGKECSWRKYMENLDQGKELLMTIVKGYGNSLIPSRFGRFPENFLVKVLEHSYDIACQIEQAVFFSKDSKEYADLYSQNLYVIDWFKSNREFIELNCPRLKFLPPIDAESLGCFKSPWCSSYEDEIFYMDTMRSLGQKYRKYPKLIGITSMMSYIQQPQKSPFAKNKNLQKFMKELATLMNRYMISVCSDPHEASQQTEEIVGLVMNLERCADILLNKTLE